MKLRALVQLFDGHKLVQPGEIFDGTGENPEVCVKASKKIQVTETEEVPDDGTEA